MNLFQKLFGNKKEEMPVEKQEAKKKVEVTTLPSMAEGIITPVVVDSLKEEVKPSSNGNGHHKESSHVKSEIKNEIAPKSKIIFGFKSKYPGKPQYDPDYSIDTFNRIEDHRGIYNRMLQLGHEAGFNRKTMCEGIEGVKGTFMDLYQIGIRNREETGKYTFARTTLDQLVKICKKHLWDIRYVTTGLAPDEKTNLLPPPKPIKPVENESLTASAPADTETIDISMFVGPVTTEQAQGIKKRLQEVISKTPHTSKTQLSLDSGMSEHFLYNFPYRIGREQKIGYEMLDMFAKGCIHQHWDFHWIMTGEGQPPVASQTPPAAKSIPATTKTIPKHLKAFPQSKIDIKLAYDRVKKALEKRGFDGLWSAAIAAEVPPHFYYSWKDGRMPRKKGLKIIRDFLDHYNLSWTEIMWGVEDQERNTELPAAKEREPLSQEEEEILQGYMDTEVPEVISTGANESGFEQEDLAQLLRESHMKGMPLSEEEYMFVVPNTPIIRALVLKCIETHKPITEQVLKNAAEQLNGKYHDQ